MATFAVKRNDLSDHIHVPVKTATGKERFINIPKPLPVIPDPDNILEDDLVNEGYNTELIHPKLGRIYAMSIDLDFIDE